MRKGPKGTMSKDPMQMRYVGDKNPFFLFSFFLCASRCFPTIINIRDMDSTNFVPWWLLCFGLPWYHLFIFLLQVVFLKPSEHLKDYWVSYKIEYVRKLEPRKYLL